MISQVYTLSPRLTYGNGLIKKTRIISPSPLSLSAAHYALLDDLVVSDKSHHHVDLLTHTKDQFFLDSGRVILEKGELVAELSLIERCRVSSDQIRDSAPYYGERPDIRKNVAAYAMVSKEKLETTSPYYQKLVESEKAARREILAASHSGFSPLVFNIDKTDSWIRINGFGSLAGSSYDMDVYEDPHDFKPHSVRESFTIETSPLHPYVIYQMINRGYQVLTGEGPPRTLYRNVKHMSDQQVSELHDSLEADVVSYWHNMFRQHGDEALVRSLMHPAGAAFPSDLLTIPIFGELLVHNLSACSLTNLNIIHRLQSIFISALKDPRNEGDAQNKFIRAFLDLTVTREVYCAIGTGLLDYIS